MKKAERTILKNTIESLNNKTVEPLQNVLELQKSFLGSLSVLGKLHSNSDYKEFKIAREAVTIIKSNSAINILKPLMTKGQKEKLERATYPAIELHNTLTDKKFATIRIDGDDEKVQKRITDRLAREVYEHEQAINVKVKSRQKFIDENFNMVPVTIQKENRFSPEESLKLLNKAVAMYRINRTKGTKLSIESIIDVLNADSNEMKVAI